MSPPKGGKRVLMIIEGSPHANAQRAREVRRFLDARGYETAVLDVLKSPHNRRLLWEDRLYFLLRKLRLAGRPDPARQMRGWADVIAKDIARLGRFDAVICQSFLHSHVLTRDLGCQKILDLPNPLVDELEFSGEYSPRQIADLRAVEREMFAGVDHLAFNWQTYNDYCAKHIYDGGNLVTLNSGCRQRPVRAAFRRPTKLAWMGYLGGYWSDLGLLSRLSRALPGRIDVFGLPRPAPSLGLGYKGFRDPEVLAGYQFGLITISKDLLRCEGFSARHLEYISFGLPVLVPEWRRHRELVKGTIAYNEDNFAEVVERFSDEGEWRRMSDAAYEQAKALDWDITLAPLDRILGGA